MIGIKNDTLDERAVKEIKNPKTEVFGRMGGNFRLWNP